VPLKPEYGPTLGQLLAPRLRGDPRVIRAGAVAAGVLLVALILAAVLTLEDATISYQGKVPFSFHYRSLYRTIPDPGGYAKVQRPRAGGPLEDSFAVEPLHLPPYSGNLSGELPLYASGHIYELTGRYRDFVLRGEGKTRVNTVPGYNIFYTATVRGQKVYGREILLLPERPGARDGVDLVMLTSPSANSQVTAPQGVGSTGVLHAPLQTFTFE
jgi:hypothetical protein